jgi:hypothetical protein
LKPQPGPGHFATAAGTGPDIDSLLLSARIAPAPQDGEGFDWSTTGSSGGDGVTDPEGVASWLEDVPGTVIVSG